MSTAQQERLSIALCQCLQAQDAAVRKVAEDLVRAAGEEDLVVAIVSPELQIEARSLAAVVLRQRFLTMKNTAVQVPQALFDLIERADGPLRRLVADAVVLLADDALLTWTLRLSSSDIRNEMLERLCSWASFVILPRLHEVVNAIMREFSLSAMRAAAAVCVVAVESQDQIRIGSAIALAFLKEISMKPVDYDDRAVALLLEAVSSMRLDDHLVMVLLRKFEYEARPATCSRLASWELILHLDMNQEAIQCIESLASRALDRAAPLENADWHFALPTTDDEDDGAYCIPPTALEGCFENDEAVAEVVLRVLKQYDLRRRIGSKYLSSSESRLRLAGLATLSDSLEAARCLMNDPVARVRAAAFESVQSFFLFDDEEENEFSDDFWDGLKLDEDLDTGFRLSPRFEYEDELLERAVVACSSDPDARVGIAAAGALISLSRFSSVSGRIADALATAAVHARDPLFATECCKAAGRYARLEAPPRSLASIWQAAERWLHFPSAPVYTMAIIAAAEADLDVFSRIATLPKKSALLSRGLVRCAVVHLLLQPPGDKIRQLIDLAMTLALECFLKAKEEEEEENIRGAAKAVCRLLRATRGLDAVINTNPIAMSSVIATGLQSALADATSLYFLANSAICLLGVSKQPLAPAITIALNRIAYIDNFTFHTESFTWPEAASSLAEAAALLPAQLPNDLVSALLLVTRLEDDELSLQVAETLSSMDVRRDANISNDIIQLHFGFHLPTCLNAIKNSDCTFHYRAACMGLCRIALSSPGGPDSESACDILISTVLLDKNIESELRDYIVTELLDLRPNSLLKFFPVYIDEPRKCRQIHQKLVSLAISNPALFDTSELQRVLTALLEFECVLPPWAQCVLEKQRILSNLIFSLVLRRHFASEEAAIQAAHTATAEHLILYPETRAALMSSFFSTSNRQCY